MNTDQNEPREGTVESKVAQQLKFDEDTKGRAEILKTHSLLELCDLVFAKAEQTGERVEISVKPPRREAKKEKKSKKDKKKKNA